MVEIKNIYIIIQNLLHIVSIFFIFCVGIWEITIISYYQNKVLLPIEYQKYNFTLIAAIINIFNSLFLLQLFFNRKRIVLKYLIILINLIIGVWSFLLYENMHKYGRFNNVIIFELNLLIIKSLLSIINSIILFCISFYKINYKTNDNIIIAEYTKVVIAEPYILI